MLSFRKVATVLVLFMALSVNSVSAQEQKQSITQDLRAKLDLFTTVTSLFSQRVIGRDLQLIEETVGQFSLKRPGMFHWKYDNGEQDIISDGKNIYFVMSDLEQVVIRDFATALTSVPSLILVSDSSKLDEVFDVEKIEESNGTSQFQLMPKSVESSYESLLLSFDGDKLKSLQMVDGLGQTTEITFDKPIYNADISSAGFEVTIPEGFDVIGGEGVNE